LWTRQNAPTVVKGVEKFLIISFSSRSIHHPNQGVARPTLFGPEIRMLELDHPPLICLYIRYVFFATIGSVDNLLPIFGKFSFPSAMPVGFVFPPRITGTTSFVGPVPNLDLSALCNRRLIANLTLAG
jgi:hypothetical protein